MSRVDPLIADYKQKIKAGVLDLDEDAFDAIYIPKSKPTIQKGTTILQAISQVFRVSIGEILGEARRQEVSQARAGAAWILLRIKGYTQAQTAAIMGS